MAYADDPKPRLPFDRPFSDPPEEDETDEEDEAGDPDEEDEELPPGSAAWLCRELARAEARCARLRDENQILKLETLGFTAEEAEERILQGFLK